jgi:hypothetical protein
MKILKHRSSTPTTLHVLILAALAPMGAGCTGTSTVDYVYDDAYVYGYYYPADVAYSSVYWADDWAYYGYVYAPQSPTPVGNDGGAGTVRTGVGDVIRRLARGEQVCPGQVTVTPTTSTPACSNGDASAQTRDGVTLVFTGCALPGGGTLDGKIEVVGHRTASSADCATGTIINLSHTTTITNLVYTGTGGGRLTIPTLTETGNNTYMIGQMPTKFTIGNQGRLQVYASNGNLSADLTVTGTTTFTVAGDRNSYSVDGALNVQNQSDASQATVTGAGLTRTTACCRPTAGTLSIDRTGGNSPGRHTWSFGSTCGSATRDGAAVSLPACL